MDLESLSKIAVICSSVTAIGSLIAAFLSFSSTRKISDAQRVLSQRQVILPLWDHISQLSLIDPKQPVAPDIIKNINALELVALCCEAEIVDEKVIIRTFSEQFINHFESISSCRDIGDGRTGRQIIKENRAAEQFYDRLEKSRKANGSLQK
ncbi:hypothetical protein AB9D06_04000 [Enterobacter cloacae]|uniref:hypothetical protein n=1 Tax=Enterobacter cloacae complex TaxID=354276 RepID=UPI000B8C7B2A|nr:hypothetical protein [Enterobacter cloacae]OXU38887.1 hypothetical protein BME83_09460 [Enterobacter cloacae subsp. cloacae]